METFIKIYNKSGIPIGFAPYIKNGGGGDEQAMSIHPSLPQSISAVSSDHPLSFEITNVQNEPTSLILKGGSITDTEIWGKQDNDISDGGWVLVQPAVYSNVDKTISFAICDNHAAGSLEQVLITIDGKTTILE